MLTQLSASISHNQIQQPSQNLVVLKSGGSLPTHRIPISGGTELIVLDYFYAEGRRDASKWERVTLVLHKRPVQWGLILRNLKKGRLQLSGFLCDIQFQVGRDFQKVFEVLMGLLHLP